MRVRLRALQLALVLGCIATLVPLAPAPSAGSSELPIQPGARMTAPFGCTLNFVFRDAAGHLSIGTAGHCVNRVGERVSAPAPTGAFGTVTFRVLTGRDDFALVRIDRDKYDLVEPSVRHFRGPTGVTSEAETEIGDQVQLFGYGMVFDQSEATRARFGSLRDDDEESYRALIPAIFGDSGGPVLHGPTGKALGVVSGMPIVEVGVTLTGTTVEHILVLLREAGIPQTLVTP